MSAGITLAGPLALTKVDRSRRRPLVIVSVVIIASFALLAVFGSIVAPYDPDALDLANPYSGMTLQHWFGTDASGRDTLSRLLVGTQVSLLAPLIVVLVSTVLGLLLGLAAGWIGGSFDWLVSRIFDILFSFPGLLIAILAVAIFGQGVVAPTIAMCIAYMPYVGRLVQTLVVSERAQSYISAYRVQGFGGFFIAIRRVLPNVSPTVFAQSSLNYGYALMDLAGLSFLGLGVQPPASDWGAMVNDAGAAVLVGHPLSAIVPAVAIVLVVVSVSIIGQELSDRVTGARAS
jgi:peptide/nickel transport system permease protein